VTLAPEGGIGTANGRTEIVYGAVVNHYDPFGSAVPQSRLRGSNQSNVYGSNVTIEQATTDLIGQITQSSPHLKTIRNSTKRINTQGGGTALTASLRGVNPNTRLNERVTVVTRQLEDDHLVYMLFITPDQEATRYSSLLTAMVNSLQVDEHAHH
jgi:hypothetical protein